MNKELIEKLKHNEKPFGLLSEEEQECLKKVGYKNCQIFDEEGWKDKKGSKFYSSSTYRIKPDYNPEPEYIEYEIQKKDSWLGIYTGYAIGESVINIPHNFLHLHCIPSMPNFEGFFAKDEKLSTEHFIHVDGVARSIKDHKVFARFEK